MNTYANLTGRPQLGDPAGHMTMRRAALQRAAREALKACQLDSAASAEHAQAARDALDQYLAIVEDERLWWSR